MLLQIHVHAKSLQSCLTLCDPMDCSPPGSSVHGILQTRILEWVAMPSSRGSSQPRDRTHVSYISCIAWQVLYHQHKLGSQLYPYSGMFYSAVNRNENLAHATEWMKLEYISLGKMSDIKR